MTTQLYIPRAAHRPPVPFMDRWRELHERAGLAVPDVELLHHNVYAGWLTVWVFVGTKRTLRHPRAFVRDNDVADAMARAAVALFDGECCR